MEPSRQTCVNFVRTTIVDVFVAFSRPSLVLESYEVVKLAMSAMAMKEYNDVRTYTFNYGLRTSLV